MSNMTEQQKARIVELAGKCESNLAKALDDSPTTGHSFCYCTFAQIASAEAFRIAQEAR